MTTAFPGALDAFTNPTGTQSQAANRTHSAMHGDSFDAIEAIEALLGITNSTDPASIDYRLRNAMSTWAQAAVGAVPQNVRDELRRTVRPEHFGAVGDGATDDAAAVQAALNAAAGRTMRFTAGKTYKIGTALAVASKTLIDATGATIIRGAAIQNMLRNDSIGALGGYNANSDITIIGGTWDGNTAAYPGTNCTVVAFGHSINITVRDARFQNTTAWHYIELNGCKDVLVENCVFNGGAEQQLTTQEAIQVDAMISAGEFPFFGPYDNTVCHTVTVRKCRFESCGSGVGTHTDPAAPHINIHVIDCYFNNTFYQSVRGQGWTGAKVIGNRVEGGYLGILVVPAGTFSVSDAFVIGNTVTQVGNSGYSGGAVGRPISLGMSGAFFVQKAVVEGNTVQDCTGNSQYGIYLNGTQKFTCCNNVVDNHNDNGIFANSASFGTISGNQVSVSGGNSLQLTGSTEVVATGNRLAKAGLSGNTKCVYAHNEIGSTQSIATTTTSITTPNLVNGVVT